MKALVLNCTLKPSPAPSNTEGLVNDLLSAFRDQDVDVELVRVADREIKPGVTSDEGEEDEWPAVREAILDSEILLIATPTWLGQPSSIAKRVLERLDGMIAEKDEEGRPVAYNHVAGCFVTGNEDGAHHVIAEVCQGLIDVGFTIPGQAWTYWHKGPGPGPSYLETQEGHEWSLKTGRTAIANLIAVAAALHERPLPVPAGG
jgi:multimeric flavodoxin WrbA